MATRSNLEEILAIHGLEERDLDQKCSIEHREEFAKRIKNWKVVGAALGFTQEELDMIDSGFPSEEQKKTALLFQWSMRDKKEATYLNLAKLLFAGEQLDLLQVLCSIIAKATSTTPAGQHSFIALLLCTTKQGNIGRWIKHHLFPCNCSAIGCRDEGRVPC